MKKISVCMLIAAAIVTGKANAQETSFGVKAGLNVYNIHNKNGYEYDSKTSVHGGLLAHIHLNQHWAIQPEVVYSAQGAVNNSQTPNSTIKMGYVNVPVLVQYMFDKGFRLEAGPQVGFLTRAKLKTNGVESDRKDYFKTVDFGVAMGASYLFGRSGLGVDARYNLGLSDINKTGNVESNNRGFQLGLFYLFPHSK